MKVEEQGAVATQTQQALDEQQHAEQMMKQMAQELNIPATRINVTIQLLDEGNTVPFIARYRKEMTGELDETQIRTIEERLRYLRQMQDRKNEVLRLIEEQGKLTDELREQIVQASKLQQIEDLYRPYKQKRKTRASKAKERGLEPLAQWIMAQPAQGDVEAEAATYVHAEKEVNTVEEAIQGAKDIIAENIADDAQLRGWIRSITLKEGVIHTAAKQKEQESVYEMYYEYEEPIRKLPSHRILAINRGEKEEMLKVKISTPEAKIIAKMERDFVKHSVVKSLLQETIADAYTRLIAPSIEREVRGELTEKAEQQAVHVFADNLKNLLLQPPIRGKTILGMDPAFRTGCKLCVVDETGKLLDVSVIYPTAPHMKTAEAEEVCHRLIEKHHVDSIVIGNGTASRETEQFVASFIAKRDKPLQYLIVNEAGASVYSASKLAKDEFPSLDVAERSAVSIARRVQDPLAELVKIDPKSIGVGQYQHDVSQKYLTESLGNVVESAVNHVGVDVNTASASLLSYVAGINAVLSKNIVNYRDEHGKFTDRKQLKKVPRLGAKTYEQCAGFLRIPDGSNALDQTPIHPESYAAVDRLFDHLDVTYDMIGTDGMKEALSEVQLTDIAQLIDIGVPTLRDMISSLQKPGRDPRDELPKPLFKQDVLKLSDLTEGMELKGTVRNVIDFGAFVDIGLKNDGLVHISQMSDRFVKHPSDVVAVGDVVTVWVLQIDENKGRVGLTMKKPSSS
ncbi:Tex family protein [Longirhabdus pacifica]|uniref:Tex family protein n=1 Tax=Longirhabdus pacifica TaxID=2305227 RepID=UPI0010093671|nr:Tex family protein [Longirhabdus pacifica]